MKQFRQEKGTLETVWSESHTRDRSWEVLKKGGRLVTIAADAEGSKEQRVRDAYIIVEPNWSQLMSVSQLIDSGIIRPIVDAVFSRKTLGKPTNTNLCAARMYFASLSRN